MSLKKDVLCSCPSLLPGTETVRFYLLGLLITLYMLAGAAVFSSLERSAELQAHQLWEKRIRDFGHEHNISHEDLKSLLHHYEEARTAGVRTERGRALWDLPGAFYFVGTVLSTIGFGVTAPSTLTGKVVLVFYGLFGCSATMLFFNLFLERVIMVLSHLIIWCHTKTTHPGALTGNEEWKPSMYQVTLMLFVAVLVVACGAASLYSVMEGWSYFESLYFCFVAFSTVGFGDFVSSQRESHENIQAYQVANCLLMLLGVCCTYSLFNAMSAIIKQGLNCMTRTLLRTCNSIIHCKTQLMSLFTLCSLASEPHVCSDEAIAPQRQVQAVCSSGQSALERTCAHCGENTVEIVCNRSEECSL